MKVLKKILPFLLFILLVCNVSVNANSSIINDNTEKNYTNINNEQITVYLFWGDGCPHCEKEKIFLGNLRQKYSNISIKDYEIWYNKDNGKLLQKVAEKLNINISGVPLTIIGDNIITGYSTDDITGKEIENHIISYQDNNSGYQDKIKDLLECECKGDNIVEKNIPAKEIKEEKEIIEVKQAEEKTEKNSNIENVIEKQVKNEEKTNKDNNVVVQKIIENSNIESQKKLLHIPFWGEINLNKLSLPIITIIIGILDGFNPCAMWILLFLISMMIGIKDRRKMWILGSVFILTSSVIYFLFMVAWLNIIIFLGFLFWIRFLIGLFAIAGGSYNIYQFLKSKDSGCHVVKEGKRKYIFDKIKDIIHKKSFLLSLVGISVLAIGVNIIELLCSAGLPVLYTQILSLNNLSNTEYYLYILLYIFFFMIDDLFVFIVSMITLKATGITTKYTKYSHIIGGILMLIIGILLLFKPDILMF